jgi:hypothetical protein
MLTINEQALVVAQNELALGAGEEGANNAGPWVMKYLNGLMEPPGNWCMAFQSWNFREASKMLGIKMPFPYSLSVMRTFDFFTKKGWIIEKDPWPGDLIFFWRGVDMDAGLGHVGIVEKGFKKNNKPVLQVVEGNKGFFPAHVARYQYNWNNVPRVLGYGRVKNG